MYLLSIMWHWLCMVWFFTITTVGWCLEILMIFITFFLAGLFLGKL